MTRLPIPWRARAAWERLQLSRPRFRRARDSIQVDDRRGRARLIAVGDIALHGPVGDLIEREGAEVALGSLLPLLNSVDIRAGNLETQLTDKGVAEGSLGSRIRARPGAIEAIVRGGFDVVTVANNHCLDFGPEALLDSVERLNRNGVSTTGAGCTPEAARLPAILDCKGIRLGLLSYCDDYIPDVRDRNGAFVAESRHDWILRDLAALRPQVDLVVIQLHWGYEFQLYPMLGHRDRARQYADAGADLVLCHHAHVPMGVERWGRSLIAHGLGNAVFSPSDYMIHGHPMTDRSLALEVEFDQAGVTLARLHPTAIRADGHVDLLAGRERDRMLRILSALGVGLNRDSRLAHIEKDRTIREGTRRGSLLVQLAADEDPRLTDAIAMLRVPRQQELLARFGRIARTTQMQGLLRVATDTPEDDVARAITERAKRGAAQEIAWWLARLDASPVPPGRTP